MLLMLLMVFAIEREKSLKQLVMLFLGLFEMYGDTEDNKKRNAPIQVTQTIITDTFKYICSCVTFLHTCVFNQVN